ncbi:MAG: DapH/DapD/GlmU-related protein [Desulforegulaceae bacterium]|nr:DapH/DapD/GlmU-related protein [Desulforegulaceae bacterium]
MKYLKKVLNIVGMILKLTYKYKDEAQPNWKYAYYFFYQRILLFNVHVPWPVHPTSHITYTHNISFGKKAAPGTGPNQYIQGNNGILIGDNVRIGPSVSIISANHDLANYSNHIITKPIKIGNNVWIGANSVILPGVEIGNNVVVGAGSVVTKNIKDNTIVAGNPCKIIKKNNPS